MTKPALVISLLVVACLIGGVLTASTVAKLSLYQDEDSPLRMVAKVAKLSECRMEPQAAEATAEPISLPVGPQSELTQTPRIWPVADEPVIRPIERSFSPSGLRAPPQLS